MIEALTLLVFWLMLGGLCVILVTGFTLVIGVEVFGRVYKTLDTKLND